MQNIANFNNCILRAPAWFERDLKRLSLLEALILKSIVMVVLVGDVHLERGVFNGV